jgi:hypothetical protein
LRRDWAKSEAMPGSSSVSNCNCDRYTSQPEKVLYCAFWGAVTVWTFPSMPM